MSEELIIEYCSPTLAGIKTGSLFSVRVTEDTDISKEVRELNKVLRGKGIRVIPLKRTSKYALIYIYRPDHLKKDLNDPQALSILKKMGYEPQNPECCIVQLVRHLKNDEAFPHEIGLFLGYPPSDVECFMKHPCKGVKCCGCWKAYSEPEKAQKMFVRFRKCTASLDAENETAIQEALSRLIKNKTVMIIAHRMRTIANADHIVVLKDGVVAEQGSPEFLNVYDSIYSRMTAQQIKTQNWKM